MNIRNFAIQCLLACALALPAAAQRTITGRVTDASNNEILPFVPVSLKGSTIGVNTDFDGKFVLRIPANSTGSIEVSCVGYAPMSRPLSSVSNNSTDFALSPTVNAINEVAIMSKSMLPQNIIRKAIGSIGSNYVVSPLNYDFEYSDEKTVGTTKRTRNAWVLFYDRAGYRQASAIDNYRNCSYKFVSAKTNFTPRTIADYSTNIDELLVHDIVRQSGNILDGARLADFDLKITGSTVFNGDSAWVIGYTCKKPGLLCSGDWNASSASGTLLIGKSDNAVLQYTAEVKTRVRNEVSPALAADTAARATSVTEAAYSVETTYKKEKGHYVLKQIRLTSPAEKRTSALTVASYKAVSVIPVDGREFLAKAPSPKQKK